jgi:2-dehydro-3-deoxyphosphooctonate aldolase (KDO 8-P synthase)
VSVAVIEVGSATFGARPLAVIAGPCVIESREHSLRMAEALRDICAGLGLPFVFKSSYDKANRSSVGSFRGPGPEQGLRILEEVKHSLGVPVISDIHTPEQAAEAAQVLDIIQIPAFLCRQTDLLLAAAATGRAVNVKKGQFLAPWDMKNVVAKLESAGCTRILLTERGASFGYNNLVVDMRGVPVMRSLGYPMVFDATHSVQLPGGQGDRSGGNREFVLPLARAAVAAGADAVFLEVHDAPDTAPCDGPNMLPLERTESALRTLAAIRELVLAEVREEATS